MQLLEKQVDTEKTTESIYFCVQSTSGGGYGVYANALLIAIHTDQASADAHCQRLRNQQSEG